MDDSCQFDHRLKPALVFYQYIQATTNIYFYYCKKKTKMSNFHWCSQIAQYINVSISKLVFSVLVSHHPSTKKVITCKSFIFD